MTQLTSTRARWTTRLVEPVVPAWHVRLHDDVLLPIALPEADRFELWKR